MRDDDDGADFEKDINNILTRTLADDQLDILQVSFVSLNSKS